MCDDPPSPGPLTRRQFLLVSLAVSLSIPAVYTAAVSSVSTGDRVPGPAEGSADVLYFHRSDAEYSFYRQPFNNRITLMPRVIAVCFTEQGVQEAVQLARAQSLPVAIKSGGHSLEGFSLNDDGMVIELSRLNGMRYDPASRRFITGPGSKLGTIYGYLAALRRLIPAGSCAGVGVAGLTLGGGYGFFSRQFGLTCDSLLRVRLVDGRGLVQDSALNPDLLWACRGGGNGNFGIVTHLEFATHPAPSRLTSYRFRYRNLTSAKIGVLAERWFGLMQTLPTSAYSAFVLGRHGAVVVLTDTADSPGADLKSIVAQLRIDAGKVYPPRSEELLAALKGFSGGTSPRPFKNTSAGYYSGYNDVRAFLPLVHARMQTQAGMLLQINTLGGAIAAPDLDATAAYPHRRFSFLGELQAYWDSPAREAAALNGVRDIQQILHEHGIRAHYRNYPDAELAGWQESYYGANYARLQMLKRQFDPDNIIRHPQSVRLPEQ